MSAAAVITGMGAISPLGADVGGLWSSVRASKVGTGPLSGAWHPTLAGTLGGEVAEVPGLAGCPERVSALALAAAREAVLSASLPADLSGAGARAGVLVGTVLGDRPALEPHNTPRASAAGGAFAGRAPETLARRIALEFGLRGPAVALGNACSAGNTAISAAAARIERGDADLMLAGAADGLSFAMLAMFAQHRGLAPDCVRPFDRDRRGLLLSEGAAFLVIEAEAHAAARGARALARVAGWAEATDAHDMVHPAPDGRAYRAVLQRALRRAGLSPPDVDYVSAHGTGTRANDPIEARAIRDVFGAHADRLAVSSLKSMSGHCQGASSALEAVACVLAIRDGWIPPTANHQVTDPECPIDVVPNRGRVARVRAAANLAAGLGGNTSCVLLLAP
ncbi:MAG TPA: beta-ketoacyl-[acyl-carrier-protein] synthase family protein [Myxococcales bacterium]|nr:beta-ketoacyl-[acyl-carrier-protein] synthase family protein [Myxococcales bacterium]